MRDRVSTKILDNGASRYGVYDETGDLLRYEYIKLEDEPSTEGDFFNKANMLPDSITAMLGLKMSNPQVADALNVLANVGNLHVWERVQTYAEPVPEVPAGYTLGEVEENVAVTGISSAQVGLYVGDSISVDSDGNVTINNEQYHFNDPSGAINGWYGSSYSTLLAGKFCRVENSTRYTTLVSGVFYVPVGTTLVNPNNNTLTIPSLQRVTGYPYTPAIPAGTHVDYLTSTDRNAYPDQSAEGGQDAYYTLGDAVTGNFKLGIPDAAEVAFRYYSAPSIVVDDGGSIDFGSDKEQFSIYGYGVSSIDSIKEKVIGKFVMLYSQPSGYGPNIPLNEIVYVPSDAGITTISDQTYYAVLDKYQPVTGHAAIPANTTITYLGQLGGGARIEVGSYVGTGTYGSSNPNSLTFGFEPKMVIIAPKHTQDLSYGFALTNQGALWVQGEEKVMTSYASSSSSRVESTVVMTLSGKTLMWYSTHNATKQLNDSGRTFVVVAVG